MANFDEFDGLKKDFLEKFSTEVTTLKKAAKSVGRTRQTIWNWRQDDPEFDEAVEQAKGKQEKMRLDAVEDSVFKQIIDGDAAASLTIFVLKNLGKGKWLDSHQIETKNETTISGEVDINEADRELQHKIEELENAINPSKGERTDED